MALDTADLGALGDLDAVAEEEGNPHRRRAAKASRPDTCHGRSAPAATASSQLLTKSG